MAMEEIIVDIAPDGSIKVDGKGFKGKTCLKSIEPLIAELGKVVHTKKKAEFYQRDNKARLRTGRKK